MFNMLIKNVKEEKDKISVSTTGAKFIFNKNTEKGEILCYQNLGKQRLLAKIVVSLPFKDLTLEEKNEERAILHQSSSTPAFLKIRINADSLLNIYSNGLIRGFTCLGNFKPAYTASEGGNFLIIDESGGIGLYPDLTSWPDKVTSTFAENNWKIIYPFNFQRKIMISVFPPKPFNYRQLYEDNVVNRLSISSPYPSNDEIKRWSKYGKILTLFSEIWKGKLDKRGIKFKVDEEKDEIFLGEKTCLNASWTTYPYIPKDEKELFRVINTAHKYKMKVISYTSPFFSMAGEDEFQEEIKRILEKYEFDGLYLDELLVGNNIEQAYRTIRNTRKLVGDKLLYLHITGGGKKLYCPFIDVYADYILRGEGFYPFDEDYLRYVISGFNISNSVGTLCSYNYPLPFLKKLIDHCLLTNVQIPYWVPYWFPSDSKQYQKMMEEEYYPKLKEIRTKGKIKKFAGGGERLE